jgi:hypothetical protein
VLWLNKDDVPTLGGASVASPNAINAINLVIFIMTPHFFINTLFHIIVISAEPAPAREWRKDVVAKAPL